MGKKPLCVGILWHMHQPDYGNEETGAIYLPWTRFHAIKDYYDMAALVAQVPELRVTFNVVPSMIDQLEIYARDAARETYAALTLRNAAELDAREKLFLLRSFFQLPWKQMIFPYPRYKDLLDRRGSPEPDGEYTPALKRYSVQDFRDLQVWFNLSWCGNELRKEPPIAEMLRRGRDFSERDKQRLLEVQADFIGRILPLYRRLLENQGIEFSLSPYYHPILPLLLDNRSAREVLPDIPLPATPFSFPGDAREHISRARDRFREVFGRTAHGMWPSEGSVSDATCRLTGEMGFRWLASDEEVLFNSLRKSGRGATLAPQQRYCAWSSADGPILFFRDRTLSDLVGFTYSRWSAEDAASDFMQRLQKIHGDLPDDGRHYLVPIILDGENAWEYYPRNGAEFLEQLYRKLTSADFARTVTFSEFLDLEPHRESLQTIAAGSWIYGCLATWIGHPEKNAAWEALSVARGAFARVDSESTDPHKRARAFKELMIAEGSDWLWWYGDDHQTANAAEFDLLFRSHLKNMYRLSGLHYPISLDLPIKRADARTQYRNPVHTISPKLDGKVTDYFEWLPAGFAAAGGGGAMHQVVRRLEKVFFGYDASRLYLRLDFAGGLQKLPAGISVQLQFVAPIECRISIERIEGRWTGGAFVPPILDRAAVVAGGKILELGIPLDALGILEPDEVRLFVALSIEGRELERFPATGFLAIPVDPWNLDQQEWFV
jgi:alpha-amylase/alpha-mannosidase (GH57 family)